MFHYGLFIKVIIKKLTELLEKMAVGQTGSMKLLKHFAAITSMKQWKKNDIIFVNYNQL
jgi:hypothetical protein